MNDNELISKVRAIFPNRAIFPKLMAFNICGLSLTEDELQRIEAANYYSPNSCDWDTVNAILDEAKERQKTELNAFQERTRIAKENDDE